MVLPGLNFRDLEYAVSVADHLHFGRASAACNVSQPTLSAQIRKLEDLLGVAIFERAARGVIVTERGAPVLAQARIILREVQSLSEVVRAGALPMTGVFRLGVIATLAPYILPLILQPLRQRFPDLDLRITDGLTAPLLRDLEEGGLDGLIAASPIRSGDLAELPLFWEPFVLAVPRDHRLAQVERVTLEDLDPVELILLAEGHCLRDQALLLCPDRQRSLRNAPGLQASGLEVLRQMIGAGMGSSLLPQLSVQVGSLLDDMVAYRVIHSAEPPGRAISLFYRASFNRIRDVRLLRTLVRDVMAPLQTVSLNGRGTIDMQEG